MARPQSIPDWQILGAARDVFLEKGIRATTAEVARRAGVAEGLLFHRHKNKLELFRAAMQPQMEDPAWLRKLAEGVGKGDIAAQLSGAAVEIIGFFRAILPLMMMSWSNPAPSGLPSMLEGPGSPPLRAFEQLKVYFAAEMRAGRLRRTDPEVVGRLYLGGLQNYVFFELLLRAQGRKPVRAEIYARRLTALLLEGAGVKRTRNRS
jgi:AcrR family transcriptional regulator